MAKNVNQAFEEFNEEIINLTREDTEEARKSRDWLIDQLLAFPDTVDDFPKDYPEKHIKYGSFARNTKIRPLDDIDLMYCISGANAYYSTSSYDSNKFYIHTENSSHELKTLSTDENTLNSIKVVNKLVKALNSVPQYSKSETKRNQEAAVLNLTSYDWSYDIVPCFYTTSNFYLIPDGSGNWKATNPKIDHENIKNTNQLYGGKVYQLVRTLKYWNSNFVKPKLSSYLFEVIVINYIKNQGSQTNFNDLNTRDFFDYLKEKIFYDVHDPKGIQGNINNLTWEDRNKVSAKAKESYDFAVTAIYYEITIKDQEKAIKNWQNVFGENFPNYE